MLLVVLLLSHARRRGLVLLFGLCLLVLSVSAGPWCGSAWSAVSHPFLFSFDGSGTPSKNLGVISGVAVAKATGDVYVADVTHNAVEEFTSSGAFVRQLDGSESPSGGFALDGYSALAVDNSLDPLDGAAGDLYVVDGGHKALDRFSPAGVYLGTLGNPFAESGPFAKSVLGVGVDPSGSVWAYESESELAPGTVYEFDSTGGLVNQFPTSFEFNRHGFAVDGGGNVYIARGFGVERFRAGLEQGILGEESCSACAGIDVDGASDEVYVDQGARVVEFDPAGARVAEFAEAQLGSGGSGGIAVDPGVGRVYVASSEEKKVYVYGASPGPRALVAPASGVQATAATINADINPTGADTRYQVEYGTTTRYGESATGISEDAGEGASFVPVEVLLSNLKGGTTYHYRVVATNSNGTFRSRDGVVTTLPVPVVEQGFAKELTPSSAVLSARINAKGLDAKYHFDWGETVAYGHSVPVPDGDVGAGEVGVWVSQEVNALAEAKTYHWRVVATNANGSTVGVDHTFVYTRPVAALPDGRAYEMVTPPRKNGALIGDLFIQGLPTSFAADGSRVMASSVQCFADAGACTAVRGTIGAPYAFNRTASGWTATALLPSASEYDKAAALNTSAGEDTVLFTTPNPRTGEDDLFTRRGSAAPVEIGPLTPRAGGPAELSLHPGEAFATSTFSRVVWATFHPTWPFDETVVGLGSAYEYQDGSGQAEPALVAVSGGRGSRDLIGKCGTELPEDVPGSLSEDGRTMFFAVVKCPEGGTGENKEVPVPVDELYARLTMEGGGMRTVAISEPNAGASPPANLTCTTSQCMENTTFSAKFRPARFDGAAADGHQVFFTSMQQLTNESSEDSDSKDLGGGGRACAVTVGLGGCNLYEYNFDNAPGRALVDVSAGDSSGGGPQVKGVVAVAADGSSVFFVAEGVLTTAPNSQGVRAKAGSDNLYVYRRESGSSEGHTRFIASLPSTDETLWVRSLASANVTPDGRYLLFTSHGNLTGDDSSTSGARQVFRFDADTRDLVRISVGEKGFNDDGNRGAGVGCQAISCAEDALIPPGPLADAIAPARRGPAMSDDGEFVFFQSPVALTPQASDDALIGREENGQPMFAQNVYEWHAGHVYLISDGRDASANVGNNPVCGETHSALCLFGTDSSGADVFFATTQQLVPQDTDTELDYYDARVCTAAQPCLGPPSQVGECSGAGCHGAGGQAPAAVSIASIDFTEPEAQRSLGGSGSGGRVKVLRRMVRRSRFAVRVVVPGAGRVIIRGSEIQAVHRRVARSGAVSCTVSLDAAARRALRHAHGHGLRVRMTVEYVGSSAQATIAHGISATRGRGSK